jgi:4-amino-4-deoxy-L-arabinose transferase-like glycosyltransferase
MSKKISAISIAFLVFAGTFVGISSANAATPYKACKPAKAKAKIGKISYTCAKNPAKASKKLVWVSKQCINANRSYKDYLDQISGVILSYESTIKRAETVNSQLPSRELAWNNQVRVNQAALDAFLAKVPNVLTTGTQKEKDSVLTAQTSIAKLKENIASLPSIKATNDETIAKAMADLKKTDNETANLKKNTVALCK